MTHALPHEVMAHHRVMLLPCDLTFLMISTLLSAAVPVVESMAALVLMDQLMAHIAQCEMFPLNIALQEPVGRWLCHQNT